MRDTALAVAVRCIVTHRGGGGRGGGDGNGGGGNGGGWGLGGGGDGGGGAGGGGVGGASGRARHVVLVICGKEATVQLAGV